MVAGGERQCLVGLSRFPSYPARFPSPRPPPPPRILQIANFSVSVLFNLLTALHALLGPAFFLGTGVGGEEDSVLQLPIFSSRRSRAAQQRVTRTNSNSSPGNAPSQLLGMLGADGAPRLRSGSRTGRPELPLHLAAAARVAEAAGPARSDPW